MKYLIFSIIVFCAISCTGPNVKVQRYTEAERDSLLERVPLLEAYVGAQSEQIDSLKSIIEKQGQGLIYLDSIVQERKFKRDRWGKAGAFIGGVIKAVK